MTHDPIPYTDTVGRLIWSAVLESEYGLVISIPDPATCNQIRDRLVILRRQLVQSEPRLNDYIIHIPDDFRSLTIKPRLANVLP